MPSIPDSSFSELENAAHEGAFGHNRRATPTDGQCAAGNYKMGRARAFGLPVVIEQPRGTYRNGVDPSGKSWTSRMAAHYGYIGGTKGADGDGVDCFIGPYLNTETAYVINQHLGGAFDEHKVMLGMPDEETARRAYNDSYDRGWTGLHSIVPTTRKQLQWWLRFGDMSRPIDAKNLPYEGLEAMTQKIYWNGDAQPRDTTLDKVLYQVRCSDSGENLLFDAVTVAEIIEDSEGVLTFDALVTPFARLERKMEVLRGVMERQGIAVKPAAMQITEPFKAQGRAMVAAIFELSDGQTVSIYFHNPDVTPSKMAPADELISWKWLLNKKDITVVVAPERGEDLNVREVARRIMALAEKNSPAFQRANAKRAETMGRIEGLKVEITSLEGELAAAQHELEVAKVAAEDRKAVPESIDPTTPEGYAAIREDDAALLKYQDQLDPVFEGRIVAVRNALGELGWGYSRSSPWPMFKGTYSVDANFKQVGAGRNIVGAIYVVKESGDFTAEFGDSLTKTPEDLAAQINEVAGSVEDPNKPITSADEFHDALKVAVTEVPPVPVETGEVLPDPAVVDPALTEEITAAFISSVLPTMANNRDRIDANPDYVIEAFDRWWINNGKSFASRAPLLQIMRASKESRAQAYVRLISAIDAQEAQQNADSEAELAASVERSRVAAEAAAAEAARIAAENAAEEKVAQEARERRSELMREYAQGIDLLMRTYGLSGEEALAEAQRLHNSPEEIHKAYAKTADPAPVVEPAAPDTLEPVLSAEATADARRQLDDEITYARQGTFSPDYLAGNREAALTVYLEAHPEAMQAHEAALAVAWASRPVENEAPPAVAEPLPDPVEPTPPPEAAATPLAAAEPAEKIADRALFQSVIDGTAPDMLAPELADQLEAAYVRHEADPELMALFERAVDAYQAAMMAATANL